MYSFAGQHAAAFRFVGPSSWEYSENNSPFSDSDQIMHGMKGYVKFYRHNPSADAPGEPLPGVWYPYTNLHKDSKWVLCGEPLPGVE